MKLPYFTKEEKENILKGMGYNVSTIDTWTSHKEYHDKMSYTDHKSTVAYIKPATLEEHKDKERYVVEQKIGLDAVFDKVGEKAMKQLMINQMINNNA